MAPDYDLYLTNEKFSYKPFTGPLEETLPVLKAEKRTILSIQDILKKRLEHKLSDQQITSSWSDNCFVTSDVLIRAPYGDAKLVLDALNVLDFKYGDQTLGLRNLICETPYDSIEGVPFTKDDVKRYFNANPLSKNEVKSNPIWKVLARDQGLLDEYVDHVYKKVIDLNDLDNLIEGENMLSVYGLDDRFFNNSTFVVLPWLIGQDTDTYKTGISVNIHLNEEHTIIGRL
ncbi:MAG TPA: hypothetical protein VJH92_03450 [Candidatus Nanoarchaeia archaeon]|nr:hypothetical protein [Candidatus Nanoarchaeia archaeon]